MPRRDPSRDSRRPAATLLLCDTAYAAAALVVCTWAAAHVGELPPDPVAAAACAALWIVLRAGHALYPGYGMAPHEELRALCVTTAHAAAAHVAVTSALDHTSDACVALATLWSALFAAPLIRVAARRRLLRAGRWGRPVDVCGDAARVHELTRTLRRSPELGLHPDTGIPAAHVLYCAGPDVGTPHATVEALRSAYRAAWIVPSTLGVGAYLLAPRRGGAGNRRARVTKRIHDLVLATVLIAALAPLMAAIAALVMLDSPGPAIYRARRVGRGGQPFECLKFRTMRRGADRELADLLAADPGARAAYAATHKLTHDPRVTRVGAWLRRSSLDELPQLFNVLRADMSLVGPRPIVCDEIPRYGSVYADYTRVRPGMSGLWQVSGRSETTYDERVALDHAYVTNWNPWLDVLILLRTLTALVSTRGAY